MNTIWKYSIPVEDEVVVNMPRFAEILCVQAQNDVLCLWAAVDTERPLAPRRISIRGTGHPLPEWYGRSPGGYVGSAQVMSGRLVFHVFERFGEAS